MSDLVDRARHWANAFTGWGAEETAAILRGLADETERLRAALEAAERDKAALANECDRLEGLLDEHWEARQAAEWERDEARAASPPAAPAAQPARPEESTGSHT